LGLDAMKRIAIFLLAFLACSPLYAGTRNLKEDTATVVVVGPFVDISGAAVTAPTIASIDITAYKNDGTAVTITPAASGSSNDMVHTDDGYFSLELTTTDTSTAGYLRLTFQISGSLIFHEDFNVRPANVYDSLVLGTDALNADVDEIAGAAVNTATAQLGVNAVQVSGDGTAADKLEAQMDRVVVVNHNGNDATSGTALQAAIEAGGNVSASGGRFEMTFPLDPPAGTHVSGTGEGKTILEFANGAGGGSHDITMVSGVVFEDLTIRETLDGVIVNLDGATSAFDWGFRRCHIETANLEPFIIQSSSACSFFLKDVRITCNTEWAMAASGGAHLFYWDNVSIYVPGNNSPTDYKAFGLAGSCTLLGNNIRLFTNEASDAGQVFRVADTAVAILTNCNFGMGDVNIEDATAFVRMTNCEFNRSGVTGFPTRLDDVMSPTMPLVSFRKLGVESDGDLTKVNLAAVIDTGGIAATSFAAGAIDATAIAANAITDAKVASDVTIASVTGAVGSVTGAVGSVTGNVGGNVVGSVGSLTGHTPQTGDAYPIVSSVTHGNAALKTIVDDVPTNAEFQARTVVAAGYALEATLNTARNDIVGEISAMQSDVDSIPTAAENAAELLATAAAGGANTVGQSLAYIRAAFGASGVFSEAALAEAPTGGGGTVIPVNQVVVPASRTWLLKQTDDGLKDEESRTMRVGETKVFAADYREDLPTNGRLSDVNSVSIDSGTSGGVTFASTDNDPGVDKTQAKVSITAVTAGTYELEFDVDYQAGEGGGSSKGIVTLVVTE
jgi:hypothetical protein